MPDPSEPGSDKAGEGVPTGISRSDHAQLRSGQGRPIGEVVNDIQRAGPRDVFVQLEDGRFVVRGPKGREHIIDVTGEHVTSVRRPDAAHQARLRDGTIRSASEDELRRLKEFAQ